MKCIACNKGLPYGDKKFLAMVYSLSPREYRVIIERIFLDYSLERVGKGFSVTRERIKQIEMKALKKLKFRASRLGVSFSVDLLKEYLENVKDDLQGIRKVESYAFDNKVKFEQVNYVSYIHALLPDVPILSDLDKLGLSGVALSHLVKDISFLELSVRSENCLRSSGINKVLDLVTMTEDYLTRIKNLGSKGVRDIKDALFIHGLRIGLKFSPEEMKKITNNIQKSFSDISHAIDEVSEEEEEFLKDNKEISP